MTVDSMVMSPTTEVTVFSDVALVLDQEAKMTLVKQIQEIAVGYHTTHPSATTDTITLPPVQLAPTLSVTARSKHVCETPVLLQILYYEPSEKVPATLTLQLLGDGKPRSHVVQGSRAKAFAVMLTSLSNPRNVVRELGSDLDRAKLNP